MSDAVGRTIHDDARTSSTAAADAAERPEPRRDEQVVARGDGGRDGDRGRDAGRPREVPARGWKDVLARVRAESKRDNVTLLAAGVAFYGLLALVPALVALLSLYGLLADPDQVRQQVIDALAAAPQEVREMIGAQIESIAAGDGGALLGVVLGLLVALWSASSGVGHLVDAINIAYDEEETRGFVRRKALALALTLGAILFVVVAVGVLTVVPRLLESAGLGSAGRWIASIASIVVLGAGFVAALAVLYRFAPDRDQPRWRWVSPGAVVAAVLFLLGSAAFSVYTANFGSYNETYGSLGAVVVVMLWLWITSVAVLLGAELNAELERQTARDTTRGPEQPLGARDAEAADTIGATAEEVRAARA